LSRFTSCFVVVTPTLFFFHQPFDLADHFLGQLDTDAASPAIGNHQP